MDLPIHSPFGYANESEAQAAGAVWTMKNSPFAQRKAWGFPKPYRHQRAILEALMPQGARVAASFPNAGGKTSQMLPLFGLSVMTAFPGSIVYTTAGSENQIEDQLFKNLAARVRPYESKGWRVSVSALTVTAPSVCGLPPSKWISRVPRDALTGEGYHTSIEQDDRKRWHFMPLFAAIDEAKSVDAEVFAMMQRLIPTWMLVMSTPDIDTGPFHAAVDPDTLHDGMEGVEVLEQEGLPNAPRQVSTRSGDNLNAEVRQ